MKTRLPLAYQILVFQVSIILLSALLGAGAAVWQARQELDRQYEQRSLAIAESVAANGEIKQAVRAGDRNGIVQAAAESVRRSTGATFVVVADQQGLLHRGGRNFKVLKNKGQCEKSDDQHRADGSERFQRRLFPCLFGFDLGFRGFHANGQMSCSRALLSE